MNTPKKARRWLATGLFITSQILLLASSAVRSESAQWSLVEQEDGISIYTRQRGESPYLEIKAEMTINARAEDVAEAFGDGNGCAAWRAMCKSSNVIEIVGENERFVHMVLDMPWPISDRDLVMHVTDSMDTQLQQAFVQFTSASEKLPTDDWVRAKANGEYLITVTDENQVHFVYIIHTDLGGNLSANMINPRVASSTIEDLQRLRVEAAER